MTFETIQPGHTFKARSGRNAEVTYTVIRKTAKRIVYGWSLNNAQWAVSANTFIADYEPA